MNKWMNEWMNERMKMSLWGLRGVPRVTDRWCATPGGWQDKRIQSHFTFNGFWVAAFLFSYMERLRQLFSFSSMQANCRTGFGYDLSVQIAMKVLNRMSEMLKILCHNDVRVWCHCGHPSNHIVKIPKSIAKSIEINGNSFVQFNQNI